MKRSLAVTLAGLVASSLVAISALAGSPHFVFANGTISDDNTLTVDFKEAGLGDETTVDIRLLATAECINPGEKHPKAANKEQFSNTQAFTVQNGQASGTVSVTATFQPSCSPPMTVLFTSATITDLNHNVSKPVSF